MYKTWCAQAAFTFKVSCSANDELILESINRLSKQNVSSDNAKCTVLAERLVFVRWICDGVIMFLCGHGASSIHVCCYNSKLSCARLGGLWGH